MSILTKMFGKKPKLNFEAAVEKLYPTAHHGINKAVVANLTGALDAKERLPFQSDGQPVTESLPLPVEPKVTTISGPVFEATADRLMRLPILKGTPAQVKWANTIRDNTFKLGWLPEVFNMLTSVSDATWWIANKSIPYTMKYKEPTPGQMASADNQPDLAAAKVAKVASEIRKGKSPVLDSARRLNDAHSWAKRMASDSSTAELAILALLTRMYNEPAMRLPLKRRTEAMLRAWDREVSDRFGCSEQAKQYSEDAARVSKIIEKV